MSGPAPLPSTAPAALRERVLEALLALPDAGGDGGGDAPAPGTCLDAGEALLARALASDERSRSTALDLLAADALVTWAFERAALERASELEELAHAAMHRIARHAALPADS